MTGKTGNDNHFRESAEMVINQAAQADRVQQVFEAGWSAGFRDAGYTPSKEKERAADAYAAYRSSQLVRERS